jgi:hypothetical protein
MLAMGAWGMAIFSDDLAADVRDEFTDYVAEGLDPATATERVLTEHADDLEDDDEAVVFWLALAATQSKLGRLLDDVRRRAVEIIDSGADLRRWTDCRPAELRQRSAHLQKLRQQLLGPQPAAKKLRRPRKSTTSFQAGDVAAYRLDERTAVRFCVLKIWGDRGGTYANICLLGLDDGSASDKSEILLNETLGPHFTMVYQEPADRITLLRRNVRVPEETAEAARAWIKAPVHGHVCTWKDLPEALGRILPLLGWGKEV